MPRGLPANPALLHDRLAAVVPELADAPFEVLGGGWDCIAIDVADAWIFKFPRSPGLVASLRREHAILGLIRPRVSLPVPEMVLHEDAEGLFSQHRKIPGRALYPEQYAGLDDGQRQALAEALARLHAQVHAIPPGLAEAAGARPIVPPRPMDEIRAALAGRARITPFVMAMTARYEALPLDRMVFGQFDGHGWNMAFDHERGVLGGMYDFGDAGIGPLHADLGYSAWVHPSLCRRVSRAYAALTGYPADPETAVLHNAVLRLAEHADGTLATLTDDPDGAIEANWHSLGEKG